MIAARGYIMRYTPARVQSRIDQLLRAGIGLHWLIAADAERGWCRGAAWWAADAWATRTATEPLSSTTVPLTERRNTLLSCAAHCGGTADEVVATVISAFHCLATQAFTAFRSASNNRLTARERVLAEKRLIDALAVDWFEDLALGAGDRLDRADAGAAFRVGDLEIWAFIIGQVADAATTRLVEHEAGIADDLVDRTNAGAIFFVEHEVAFALKRTNAGTAVGVDVSGART